MLNTVCLKNSASLESDYRRRHIYFGHVSELYNSPSDLYTYIYIYNKLTVLYFQLSINKLSQSFFAFILFKWDSGR